MVALEYYDKLLLGIIGGLGAGAAIGLLTTVAFQTGMAIGAVLATPFVYDAMFRNPPLPQSTTAKAAAVAWHVFLVGAIVAALV